MKKILLAAVGLTGLLASCGSSDIAGGGYFGTGSSSNLRLRNLSNYQTSWRLSNEVRDQNNRVIPARTFVICDNTTTQISFDVNWSGYLSQLGLQIRGNNTDNYKNIGVINVGRDNGNFTAQYDIGSGLAPLSLNGQSIVVNPVTNNVRVKGYTYVRAQGQDANGFSSNIVTSNFSIPVVDCR